jgi:hypothetical protein
LPFAPQRVLDDRMPSPDDIQALVRNECGPRPAAFRGAFGERGGDIKPRQAPARHA